MHPRGPLDLVDLPSDFKISAQGEELADLIAKVQEEVQQTLQNTTQKYKAHVDKKRKELHFRIEDKVWAYLRKERLPKGRYSKLYMKKVRPCTILNKMGDNAYEISLPPTLQISPIFNSCDLTSYKGDVGIDIIVGPSEGACTSNDQIFHD